MRAAVAVTGPLDVAATLARFRLWGEDPSNQLSSSGFRRVVRLDGRCHAYELTWSGRPDSTQLEVMVPGARGSRVMEAALAEVRRICGLDLDVDGFYRIAEADRVLGGLVPRLYGLRPTLTPRPFEMLVGSVCAQQVNLTFAFAVRARLIRRFGVPVAIGGDAVYAFPEPEALARAAVDELRAMQFTVRKAEYIIELARRVADGELDLVALCGQPNEQVIECLTRIRGFGRWTAEWFLARGLGRGDVCPAGDLGVRKAFAHFYNRGCELTERAIRRRAARWGAHQNVAVHYLLAGQRLARASAGGGV